MPVGFGNIKKEEKKEYAQHNKRNVIKEDNVDEVNKIIEMLNPDEKVLLVARQSKIKPGGSFFTPNTIYATNRRIIIRDPYILGLKANVVDIPYDIITSLKLEKGILSSTIRFKAAGLISSKKLGMIDSIVTGEDDSEGIIEAIPKDKAEDLLEIIRSGMQDIHRTVPSNKQKSTNTGSNEPNESIFNHSRSFADELLKLVKLRDEGILTEQEFNKMKRKIVSE
jgi:hypothetical protein